MCWKSKIKPIKEISEEDITVIKVLKQYDNKEEYYSPFQDYRYFIGKKQPVINQIKILEPSFSDCTAIYNGYHSYSINCYAEFENYPDDGYICDINVKDKYDSKYIGSYHSLILTFKTHYIFAECIIPKGAEYYENEKGEFVSNTIILKKILSPNITEWKIILKDLI